MFLSSFESSVDVKKRVSIPAPFRKSLGGRDSVYLWESLDKPCIEGCGQALVDHFEASISDLDLMDKRRFALATTILGDLVHARLDDGGRITMDSALMSFAGAPGIRASRAITIPMKGDRPVTTPRRGRRDSCAGGR